MKLSEINNITMSDYIKLRLVYEMSLAHYNEREVYLLMSVLHLPCPNIIMLDNGSQTHIVDEAWYVDYRHFIINSKTGHTVMGVCDSDIHKFIQVVKRNNI